VVGRPVVLKLGGELLEDQVRLQGMAAAIRTMAASSPLALVHGGGREIDAALKAAGLEKRQVDGLRITDDRTLEVVVAVLAGTVNTHLVAALTAAGVRAVGLTGADGGCGRSEAAPPHRMLDGRLVDLGRVGVPSTAADMALLTLLLGGGYVPVLACLGIDGTGRLLNVNADTLAGHLAARLGARRLIIAGTTAGVLGPDGGTLRRLEPDAVARLIDEGTATVGMVAKLRACEDALDMGVDDVLIVDGRDPATLAPAADPADTEGPPRSSRLTRRRG
jgi:acetylglutamate kinase